MGFHSVCRPWLFLCALRPDAVDQRLPNVRILRAQALTEIEFHVLPIDKNYGLWVAPCWLESTYPAHCLEHFLAYRHAVAGDRKRVGSGKSVSVRVGLGGSRQLKNKIQRQKHAHTV